MFVDKEAIKVANLLRGSEKNSKQTTNDSVIYPKLSSSIINITGNNRTRKNQ